MISKIQNHCFKSIFKIYFLANLNLCDKKNVYKLSTDSREITQ